MESLLTHFSLVRNQEGREGSIRQIDGFTPFIFDLPKLQVRIAELPKRLARRLRHLPLHGEQSLFRLIEGMGSIAIDPL
jgi:hypothetical protein